jgi:hypothetical protein
VGATSESVTVTTEASLLTTESAELSRNVTIEALDSLPLTGIGTVDAPTSGYRNPYNSLLTLPGVSSYNTTSTFTVNDLVGGSYLTETMRVEGQEATSQLCGTLDCTNANQPSVDAAYGELPSGQFLPNIAEWELQPLLPIRNSDYGVGYSDGASRPQRQPVVRE